MTQTENQSKLDITERAALCLLHLKDGLEKFVEEQSRQHYNDIIQYVKKQSGLSTVKCTQCTNVKNIIPDHVIKKTRCPHNQTCKCKVTENMTACPNNICGIVYDKITTDHFKGNPAWQNTKPAQWTQDFWEVAKCYMETRSLPTVKSVSNINAQDLLSICINNISIRKKLNNVQNFQQGLKQTSMIFCCTTEKALVRCLDRVLAVLRDKTAFSKDDRAEKAVFHIQEIKQDCLKFKKPEPSIDLQLETPLQGTATETHDAAENEPKMNDVEQKQGVMLSKNQDTLCVTTEKDDNGRQSTNVHNSTDNKALVQESKNLEAHSPNVTKHRLTSAFYIWPAYKLISSEFAHLDAMYSKLLSVLGLRESTEQLLLKNRHSRNVTVRIVASAERESQDIFNLLTGSKGMFHVKSTASSDGLEKSDTFDPVVFVAREQDLELILDICRTENIVSNNSQIRIVLVKDVPTRVPQAANECLVTFPVTYTILNTIIDDIDDELEKYAFETVHMKAKALQYLLLCLEKKKYKPCDTRLADVGLLCADSKQPEQIAENLEQHSAEMRELYAMLEALYKRHEFPIPPSLLFPKCESNQSDVEQFIANVRALDATIIGHGENCGTIHIYIDESMIKSERKILKQKIKTVAKIGDQTMNHRVHFVSREIKPLADVGAEVGKPYIGTLGGYAMMIPHASNENLPGDPNGTPSIDTCDASIAKLDSSNGQLCALLSRHVAQIQNGDELIHNDKGIARIMKPIDGPLDIAVAIIHESYVKNCDTQLKNENGLKLPGKLFDFNKDSIPQIVHIWGSKSRPGVGAIVDSTYKAQGGKPHLLIIDHEGSGQLFCEPGDSGAFVCTCDKRGNIFALGMLVGQMISEEEPVRYYALRLNEGLEQLSEIHEARFLLGEENEIRNSTSRHESEDETKDAKS